jgi:hypothetical protein
MAIAQVDFGRVDAEGETNLSEYFVDTGVLSRLISGRKQFVIGRKGSGKTALFLLATEEKLGRPVLKLDFGDYAWEAHKLIKEAGLIAESSYVASWRFTFLMFACQHWTTHGPDHVRRKAVDFYKRIYREEEPGVLEFLIDKFRRLRRLDLPGVQSIATAGGFELDESEGGGPLLASSINQWARVLLNFVEENFDHSPFTITLDRLDDGWDASEDSKALLAGVLKAARDFNQALYRPNQPAPVLTFLRSDIFNELRFNDKNKIVADIEFLDWTEGKLIDVASARIARSLQCTREAAWNLAFSSVEMRQRASIQSYILKRTMWRPRDIIAFCKHCQDVAIDNDHDKVQTTDVYDAEERFSKYIYDELDDEMHKQVADARSSLQALRDVGLTRFRFDDWVKVIRKREAAIPDTDIQRRLQDLFDYSVVGVQRRGGITRGTTFQFVYHDRLLEPNFNGDMIVHPSLTKHLRLKEPRAKGIRDEAV